MTRIAILADPHFHDIHYDWSGAGEPFSAVRTFADTAASTRVFNESGPALRAALDDIAAKGISLVIIAGDLTDDGQIATTMLAAAVLDDYAERHGMRFFLTPGNHDLYALHGRHQSKRFLNGDGSHTLVTSDAAALQEDSASVVVREDFYCPGYGGSLPLLRQFGYFNDGRNLHWETPFGVSDDLKARTYRASSSDGLVNCDMVDASYLVEPIEGLWLLSVDANVFVPKVGARNLTDEASFHDSTDAGWRELVVHKPHLLVWMADVARRAKEQGKRLLTFSHYPALDPLDGTLANEIALFGDTGFSRRTPSVAVADAVAGTGIKVHFSGHLHVNDTALHRNGTAFVVNVAMPSLVGFAPAYKIAEFAAGRLNITTVPVYDAADYDEAFASYGREAEHLGVSYAQALAAGNHGDFMSRHVDQLVHWRYLVREWPRDMAALVPELSFDDLVDLAGLEPVAIADVVALPISNGALPSFADLVTDWYRLRKASRLALDFIGPERIEAYEELMALYARGTWTPGSVQAWLGRFLQMMGMYLNGQPSVDFSIDLAAGQITPTGALSRTDGFAPDRQHREAYGVDVG